MSQELITADTVSRELLKAALDAAFLETAFDEEGTLFVQEQCKCFVNIDKDKRVICLRAYYGFTDRASEVQRLTCVNNINASYLFVRAVVHDHVLGFHYDISLDGGLTRKAFVLLLKRFCMIPLAAISDYGKDIVR